MILNTEKSRKILDAMSPTPWIVLEDDYGAFTIIRNPNHPIHEDGLVKWGLSNEAETPDAKGITYMRSEFPNALDEIERLRAEAEEAQESLTAAYLLGRHQKAQEMATLLTELKTDLELPARAVPAEGKIGPDARPHCWQITEERVEALQDAINRYDVYDRCLETYNRKMHVLKILQTMVEEAK